MMTILKFHGELVFGNGYRNSESADDLDGSIHIGGADVLSQIANVQFNGPVTVAIADERYSGDLAYELGWGYSEVTPVDDDKLTVGPHDIIARLNQYEAGQIVTMWIADEPFNRLPDELQARIADDERHVTMMLKAADYDALVARLAVAEAERDDLSDANGILSEALEVARPTLEALTARVAELEAALATRPPGYLAALDARDEVMHILQRIAALVDVPGNAPAEEIVSAVERAVAGQGWTPGDETPAPDWYQTAESPDGGDGAFSHAYFDGAVWLGYPDNQPPMWYRPIPPLPQEPTP